jgi:hypothetical protein
MTLKDLSSQAKEQGKKDLEQLLQRIVPVKKRVHVPLQLYQKTFDRMAQQLNKQPERYPHANLAQLLEDTLQTVQNNAYFMERQT